MGDSNHIKNRRERMELLSDRGVDETGDETVEIDKKTLRLVVQAARGNSSKSRAANRATNRAYDLL